MSEPKAQEKTEQDRYGEWLSSGSVGASAKTIASVMLGRENPSISYPHDSGDFGRCLNLLSFVPEWEKRLPEMSKCPDFHGEIWSELVEVWDGLKKMFSDGEDEKVTEEIKKIITPIENKSGKVGRMGKGVSISSNVSMPAQSEEKSEADELIEKEEKRVEEERAAKPDLPGFGHNSEPDNSGLEGEARDVGGVAGQRLRSFIERVERLEEEKAALAEDIKEVWAEFKGIGYHVPTGKKIVKLRKMDHEKRREEEELLDLYKSAIGMH